MIISRLALLGALLAPAAALAQPTDPDAPLPPPPVQQPVTTQSPTVIVNPPAAPAPAPEPVAVEAPLPPPTPVVEEYDEVDDAYNAPIFVSGALVFGASYGASAIAAASSDDTRGNHRLYVPLAGPWLALNDRGSCDVTLQSCDHETTVKVLLIADGVFQAAGVLGMIDGIFQPSSHRVVRRAAKLDTKIHVTPTTMQHGDPGVAVFGRW